MTPIIGCTGPLGPNDKQQLIKTILGRTCFRKSWRTRRVTIAQEKFASLEVRSFNGHAAASDGGDCDASPANDESAKPSLDVCNRHNERAKVEP